MLEPLLGRGKTVLSQVMKQLVCQVLAAVNVFRFRNDFLFPNIAQSNKFFLLNRLKEIGPRQMQTHVFVLHDGRQVERLMIDREVMFTESDDVLAVNEQLLFVFQLPNSVFASGFQLTLNIVDFDSVA